MRLKRIAHYNVSVLIGEGGKGQVWQATDTQLSRQVALWLPVVLAALRTPPHRALNAVFASRNPI